jgi:hypothetical protein
MEIWLPLLSYPGYSASDQGRVRNDKRDSILAVVRVKGRRSYVGLMSRGTQVKRSLSRLICETFVPNQRKEYFDTPIHVDGDLANCKAVNLQWRPRWFADRYSFQFTQDLGETLPVRNINTGVTYSNVWEVVFAHGVLFNDVVLSIANKTYVFPLMHNFEWIE